MSEHSTNKRIVLVSHNTLGFRCLKKLIEKKFNVIGVIGRIKKPGEIISDYSEEFENFCSKNGVLFKRIEKINSPDSIAIITALKPDVIFVFGWSQIIKDEIFSIPRLGIYGTHPSLLPKNRGNAAIPWQIINNEKKSGLTLFKMQPGKPVDSGNIYAQESFDIELNETAESFYEKLVVALERIIETTLSAILEGKVVGIQQEERGATYLGKRTPEDSLIDWNKDVEYIERFIRALGRLYPSAFCYYEDKVIKIIKSRVRKITDYSGVVGSILYVDSEMAIVQCGKGLLEITKIVDEEENELDIETLKTGKKFK